MNRRRVLKPVACPLLGVVFAALAGAPARAADSGASCHRDKIQCAAQAEHAQRLRMAGRLLDARSELQVCVRTACPTVVRSDCTRWLGEVEAAIPSIVVHARDAEGTEARDVSLAVDGVRVAERVGDSAVELDPGDHLLEYTRPGGPAVAERVSLAQGEKGRVMTVRFLVADAKSLAFPAGAAAARPPEAPPPAQHRGSPNVAAWTSAGVALVALGAFAYFGVTGKSELDQLHESCTGNCDPSSVDAAWTKLLVADVSLGVAVLGAGAATWFFLSGHDDTPEGARSSAASLGFAPSPHGVSLRWEKSF